MSLSQRPLQLCFGGSFDPVHNAHLRALWEASHALQPERVRLLPSHIPPHKDLPESSSSQRVAMLRLALRDQPDWLVDERELARDRASYTLDTLVDLRRELGEKVALVWLIGMDSFASLDSWHHWQALAEHAHLLVVARPGATLPESGPVADWARPRWAALSQLRDKPAGSVAHLAITQQDVASSQLRAGVRSGLAPRYLVPDTVCTYIIDNGLYS